MVFSQALVRASVETATRANCTFKSDALSKLLAVSVELETLAAQQELLLSDVKVPTKKEHFARGSHIWTAKNKSWKEWSQNHWPPFYTCPLLHYSAQAHVLAVPYPPHYRAENDQDAARAHCPNVGSSSQHARRVQRGCSWNHLFSSDAAVARAVTVCLCRDFSDLGSILAAGGSTTINGSGCDSESGANGRFARRVS